MVGLDRKEHWEEVYSTKDVAETGWHQREPRLSLDFIRSAAPAGHARIIDVGGGASNLVDRLLDLPFASVAVLDISRAALDRARARLGGRANYVEWIEADIVEAPDLGTFDVWHDRAVFHFLTDADDRREYVGLAARTVPKGGHLVIATFADDGPERCSGLEVRRYNAETLARELGERFALVRQANEAHETPSGKIQSFFYGAFQRQ